MRRGNSNLVARIVVWAVIGVLALILLIWAATGGGLGSLPVIRLWNSSPWGGDAVNVISTATVTEAVDTLDIDWTSGGVTLVPVDGSEIVLREKSSRSDAETRMIQSVKGGVLTVDSKKQTGVFFLWWLQPDTTLEISLPRKVYDRMAVKAASGTCDLTGMTVGDLSVDLTSGKLVLDRVKVDNAVVTLTSGSFYGQGMSVKKLDTRITSGTLDLAGDIGSVNLRVTSGTARLATTVMPTRLDADMTSGNMTFTLPENSGFSVDVKTTSGNFNSDFAMASTGGRRMYLNGGSLAYSLSCTSGNISIRRAD